MWLPLVNSTNLRPEARIRSSTSTAPGCGTGAAVGAAVRERAVDVEHEPAHVVEAQAVEAVKHGATPPCRRRCG